MTSLLTVLCSLLLQRRRRYNREAGKGRNSRAGFSTTINNTGNLGRKTIARKKTAITSIVRDTVLIELGEVSLCVYTRPGKAVLHGFPRGTLSSPVSQLVSADAFLSAVWLPLGSRSRVACYHASFPSLSSSSFRTLLALVNANDSTRKRVVNDSREMRARESRV